MKKFLGLILFCFVLFSSCNTFKHNEHNIEDLKKLPFNRTNFYNGNLNVPIEERIVLAPDNVIEFNQQMDGRDNYSPCYSFSADDKKLFMDYFSLLPAGVRSEVEEKVIAIYFIDNYAFGGMTYPVFDESDNLYAVLYFNSQLLRQSLSQWFEFRENSYFNENKNYRIEVDFNKEHYALLHTLTHEAAHVYDQYNGNTPYVQPGFRSISTLEPTAFTKDIWLDYRQAVKKYDYPYRTKLSAYGYGKKQNKALSVKIYENLRNTPFVSIYGSASWAEDFAETFFFGFMNDVLDTQCVFTVYKNDKPVMSFNPMENPSVKARLELISDLFK